MTEQKLCRTCEWADDRAVGRMRMYGEVKAFGARTDGTSPDVTTLRPTTWLPQ